jgi:4-aminobutyrate aminotransferase-like enzyme
VSDFAAALERAQEHLRRVRDLHASYRGGQIHVHVPSALLDHDAPLDDLVAACLPASNAALAAASKSLFFSLPVAFDPSQSIGPYLATADRDPDGAPYRFLDLGALIATHAFGENEPAIVAAVLEHLPYVVDRYAHSEYQTLLSLRLKAALERIAPAGTPRHFVVNTGAEAVENAIKSVLLNRVVTAGEKDGGFIISFEGAFHGRTLGSLAVTHRRKAKLGFPTFDWPHAPFPLEEPSSPKETARREERSLWKIWELLVSGRLPNAVKNRDQFRRELETIDAFLASPGDFPSFVAEQRAALSADVQRRARRVAAVLVEPIQGEGGVRTTTARFMQRLRAFTRIYDVPLMFDEVQTGWGTTGHLWAHHMFELPAPPDIVIWAKKAQNGVLFVSEELATFFQEEKKFNTTWEGDSAGMVRLLAMLDHLDLDQVRRTSDRSRTGLEALSRDFRGLLKNVRGHGVMLGFDVVRADWRDALRERAFRRGLVLLPAGERTLRFYPRHDTEPYAIDEGLGILRDAVLDVAQGRVPTSGVPGPNIRVGQFDCPLEAIEIVDVTATNFETWRTAIATVEQERYGDVNQYPEDVLREGRRPLLQLPVEALETSVGNAQSIAVALRDRVSDRVVAYALGSPLENYDEEGVSSDPHYGEGNTFYLQAMATLPSVQNQIEIESVLLECVRERAAKAGFEYLSALVEERVVAGAPAWLREAPVLVDIDSYLRSGVRFVYVQAPVSQAAAPAPAAAPSAFAS